MPASPWDDATATGMHLYRTLPGGLWECWTCRTATPTPIEHGAWHGRMRHPLPAKLPLGWRWSYEEDPITGRKHDTLTKETQ